MTTINVKDIEELSTRLHQAVNVGIAEDSANALDALLAFYKESVEQEPVAKVVAQGQYEFPHLQWVSANHSFEVPIGSDLYATPPASAARIAELEQQLETERMRLAACGVAALGYFDGCKDEYISASLEDTLRLREANEKQEEKLRIARDALKEVLPWVVTQTVACHGMKCRELVCLSCNDDEDAENNAQIACDKYGAAKEALAALGEE